MSVLPSLPQQRAALILSQHQNEHLFFHFQELAGVDALCINQSVDTHSLAALAGVKFIL